MRFHLHVFGFGDVLPTPVDRDGSKTRTTDTQIKTENALSIPGKVDEKTYYSEIGDYGKGLIRREGGINVMLDDYHATDEGTLQDFFINKLLIKPALANKLAEAVVDVYREMQEDEDDGGDEVEELHFDI